MKSAPVSWPSWMTFRPLIMWPGETTKVREASPFFAPWAQTVKLLERELDRLRAERVVLQVALSESQIRKDGMPRSGVRADHPGVVLAFGSKYGPLQYATDRYPTWEDNVRAIGLALEALRKVDRYGVSKRGEQYTGWKQLAAGPTMSQLEAAEMVLNLSTINDLDPLDAGSALGMEKVTPRTLLTDPAIRTTVVRMAKKRSHPDSGGSPALWERLAKALEVLGS